MLHQGMNDPITEEGLQQKRQHQNDVDRPAKDAEQVHPKFPLIRAILAAVSPGRHRARYHTAG